jgi:hypothetical protein
MSAEEEHELLEPMVFGYLPRLSALKVMLA